MTYPLTSSIASSFAYLFVYLFAYLFAYLFTYLFTYLFAYLFASISRSKNTLSQQKKDNTNAQAKGNNAAEHIMVGSHIYRLLSRKYRKGA